MVAEIAGAPWFAMLIGALVLAEIFLVPLWAIVRTSQRRRQWEHEERLRALEHGLTIPARVSAWPVAFVCVMLGAVMPVSLFVIASLADPQLWITPVVVGVAGVLGALVLGNRWLTLERGGLGPVHSAATAKPPIDDDAFDVVGSRG